MFPLPHGDAGDEWTYLEGELAGWDWTKIARSENAEEFVERDPPLPVTHWPIDTPAARTEFPRITVTDGGWVPLLRFQGPISASSWLLFMNDIPETLWTDIIVILIEHHLRLDRLANVSRELEENQKIRDGMLAPDYGIAYLHALSKLLPKSGIENWQLVREAARKVIITLKRSRYFQGERYADGLKKKKKKLERMWRQYEGPDRRYRKEAARYLRPVVRDLFDYLEKHLQYVFENNPSHYLDNDPKPPSWLRTDFRRKESATVRRGEIYRVIGDLLRFFYPWQQFKVFDSGIEPPEWRGDTTWSRVPDEARSELAKIGRKSRMEFGKRMQMIHRRTR